MDLKKKYYIFGKWRKQIGKEDIHFAEEENNTIVILLQTKKFLPPWPNFVKWRKIIFYTMFDKKYMYCKIGHSTFSHRRCRKMIRLNGFQHDVYISKMLTDCSMSSSIIVKSRSSMYYEYVFKKNVSWIVTWLKPLTFKIYAPSSCK